MNRAQVDPALLEDLRGPPPSPTRPPTVSTSDTKTQNGTEPARRNRMIPTFYFPGRRHRGSFVSDLDTDALQRPAMRSGSSARVRESLLVCVEDTPGVLGRAEGVGGLPSARVLVSRHEDRTAVARDDLDSMMTGGDAVDERRQRPARFVRADGHRHSPGFTRHWRIVSTPSPRMVARVAGAAGSEAQILHYTCVTDVHLRQGELAEIEPRWTRQSLREAPSSVASGDSARRCPHLRQRPEQI